MHATGEMVLQGYDTFDTYIGEEFAHVCIMGSTDEPKQTVPVRCKLLRSARELFQHCPTPTHQTYGRKLVTDSIEISFLSLLHPLLRDVDNGIVELVLALLD